MNLEDRIYDKARIWISDKRSNKIDWEKISLACKESEDKLGIFLQHKVEDDDWPEMTIENWKYLVQSEKEAEEETLRIDQERGAATIHDNFENNEIKTPQLARSSWQCYKRGMLGKGFSEETVKEIEQATLRILRRLSSDTRDMGPIKGMVIGNVQSGKTANMAALMAMAADWGWNMFIVLSGTIENLRRQTQDRLFTDLNDEKCDLTWRSLEHLKDRMNTGNRAQDLRFGNHDHDRYFTVCLKNTSRLKNLSKWLKEDPKTQRLMKVLVIDDEADQAGINTADINASERRRINGLICRLVNGEKVTDKTPNPPKFMAMNYIGYTATPYANILNENSPESLYPRSFISALRISNEYFGPQQLFGTEDNNYDGLDIIRTISESDIDNVKEIHSGDISSIPETLIDSICWFMCGVGCMRFWGYKKPITMLVHTSQKTEHHEHVANIIEQWIRNTNDNDILNKCKDLWENERIRFSKAKFREQFSEYGRPDDVIKDYPSFDVIEEEIHSLLSGKRISSIPFNEEEQIPKYHNGIHLCIDNCMNNGIENETILRLVYPDSDKMPSPAPAFIVVGGATLSRGLTLEGLISTYFLRSVKQSDTLMQMGRWFGYRKGYELIPRIWLSENTEQQFHFLSSLDQDLREEIHRMDVLGRTPAEYGPRVKNTPKITFIRIVAKNKMQSAQASEMDYTGTATQTYIFDNNIDTLESNMRETKKFLIKLGQPEKRKEINEYAQNSYVWRNVEFSIIKTFLTAYKYQKRQGVFNDIHPLIDWIKQVTERGDLNNWNVVLVGADPKSAHVKTWKLYDDGRDNDIVIGKTIRTKRKNQKKEEKDIINLGGLRAPQDVLIDIDMENVSDKVKEEIKASGKKHTMFARDMSGLNKTPQLLIYIVDKNSSVSKTTTKRCNLEAVEDIAGFCIDIPGNTTRSNCVATVSIPIPQTSDVCNNNEDIDENAEN